MTRLVRFERTVSNLQRAADFYAGPLGFEVRGRRLGEVVLERGGQVLALQIGQAIAPPPTACDGSFQHLALPVADMAAAVTRLPADVRWFSRGGPQRLPERSGGVIAVKFRDPDGHPLELIEFPDGRAGGIDHSALVVADAARSIAFYERLGFRVGPRQTNRGPEQDRLDGLEGTEVDVVALLPSPPTPHVELLAYRHPAPAGTGGPSATRLVFAVPGVTETRALTDPDGHCFVLTPELQ